ncbi:MAG: ABC transporter ATP-binding protein [bacterium]|nr:ABC transporter ATP-binding protein [bacterium]
MTSADRGGIEVHSLGVTFPATGTVALLGIDLRIADGEFVCVVGPSGCGKTTFLRILAGLEEPSAGEVVYDVGLDGRPLRSMVFQEHGVFPWMSVLDNAAYGLVVRNVPKHDAHAHAMSYLRALGLSGFEHRYPRQLSGGMRQRVNLARAFANDPAVLLMDEPLASLDEQTKLLVQDDLVSLWERSPKSVVYVTHSLDEAVALADRVVVMTARPGRIKAIVPIPLPRPRHVLDLQQDGAFLRLRAGIWEMLRDEVRATRAVAEVEA